MGVEINGNNKKEKGSPPKTIGVKKKTNPNEIPRLKVVIVGDGGSGKTSLLIVFTQGQFPEEYIPTVFENYTTEMSVENHSIHLLLWDTAGQEDYDRLRPLSYDKVDVIIMCYDVMSSSSFDNISIRWAPEIRHFCPGVPLVLVGCKTDLRADPALQESLKEQGKQPVTTEKGDQLAKDLSVSSFIECSAKLTDNVDNVFRTVSRVGLGIETGPRQEKPSILFTNCSNCSNCAII